MKIVQTEKFQRAVKKLHKNQKADLYAAIRLLEKNPLLGNEKKGDLTEVRVYKFKMVKQETLLAYYYHQDILVLTLLMFGSHENFYRDLKRD